MLPQGPSQTSPKAVKSTSLKGRTMTDLYGKVAIITGASRGIGQAISAA